jgi:endonuclease/exonuclease/phosphatase family metal-dependent hydrolase
MLRHSFFTLIVAAACGLSAACSGGTETGEAGEDLAATIPPPVACNDAKPSDASCALTVVTINLRHDESEWEARRRQIIIAELNRLRPDIIGMQEVEIGVKQGEWIQAHLSERYNRIQNRKTGLFGFLGGEGIATLSRFPIVEDGAVDLGERRVVQRGRIQLPQGSLIDVFNTHLHADGAEAGDKIREAQAKDITQYMSKHEGAVGVQLLTGDMNAKEGSPAIKHFVSAGMNDSFRTLYPNAPGVTSPVPLERGIVAAPKNRIDFIFSKGPLRPIRSTVVLQTPDREGYYGSDHFSVMTVYAVKLR